MMVAISFGEHFDCHAEEASGLPYIDAGLHEPRCCRVSQDVRRNLAGELSVGNSRRERLANRGNRLTVPFDGKALAFPLPTSKVGQQIWWQWNRWLSLFRFTLACRTPVKHAAAQVDPSSALGRFKCCTTNGAGAR